MTTRQTSHATTVQFLSGVEGNVTPTCYVLQHYKKRIMIDCGITPGINSIPEVPEKIDMVVLTHPHIDHIGGLLHFWMKNKCPVYIPKGSKHAMETALRGTYKIQGKESKMHEQYQRNMSWLQAANETLTEVTNLLQGVRATAKRMNRKGRKNPSVPHNIMKDHLHAEDLEHDGRLESAMSRLQRILEINDYHIDDIDDIKILADTVGVEWNPSPAKKIHHYEKQFRGEVLRALISKKHAERMAKLAADQVITPDDVERCIKNLRELTLDRMHRVFHNAQGPEKDDVELLFKRSGHLYSAPSAQVLFRLGGKNGKHVLATGDLGNDKLPDPYPKIDSKGLEGIADAVITEATYGGSNHPDREIELNKFDEIIIRAIRNGEDIVLPIISLDRPMFGMYEIVTRLFEKQSRLGKIANIKPGDVECLYFGNDIANFIPKGTEVWEKIRRYLKPLNSQRLPSLAKKGSRPRIIFAGGGFLPSRSPAAGTLVYVLKQSDAQVLFINYCGADDSNAWRLLKGHEFDAFEALKGGEEIHHVLQLKGKQKGHRVQAFSGHPDQDTIVKHVELAAKPKTHTGVKVFINHAGKESAQTLKTVLRHRGRVGEIVLPKKSQIYPIKKIPKKK